MMKAQRILEVTMEVEGSGPTHQALRLEHGRWAVAWRKTPYAEGDYLPGSDIEDPLMDHGVKLLASQQNAERFARQLAHLRETASLDSLLRILRDTNDTDL